MPVPLNPISSGAGPAVHVVPPLAPPPLPGARIDAPAAPRVGIPDSRSESRRITDEWSRSATELATEFREIRTAMHQLLADLRNLLKDYRADASLQDLMTAIDDTGAGVTGAIEKLDRLAVEMEKIDTTDWDVTKKSSFNQMLVRARQIVDSRGAGAGIIPVAGNGQAGAPLARVAHRNHNHILQDLRIEDSDDTIESSRSDFSEAENISGGDRSAVDDGTDSADDTDGADSADSADSEDSGDRIISSRSTDSTDSSN